MFPKKLAVVCLIAFSFSNYSSAQISYNEYKKNRSHPGMRDYIAGVGRGVGWANAILSNAGKIPLSCPPGNLTFSTDDFIKIIENGAKKDSDLFGEEVLEIMPIERTLVQGMYETYPCRSRK
jgi:hypothetical protein